MEHLTQATSILYTWRPFVLYQSDYHLMNITFINDDSEDSIGASQFFSESRKRSIESCRVIKEPRFVQRPNLEGCSAENRFIWRFVGILGNRESAPILRLAQSNSSLVTHYDRITCLFTRPSFSSSPLTVQRTKLSFRLSSSSKRRARGSLTGKFVASYLNLSVYLI